MTKREFIDRLYEKLVGGMAAMIAVEGDTILLHMSTGEIFRIEVKQK